MIRRRSHRCRHTQWWRLLRILKPGTRLVELGVLELKPVHGPLSATSVHDQVGGLWTASCGSSVQVRRQQGCLSVNCGRVSEEMQLPCAKKRAPVEL